MSTKTSLKTVILCTLLSAENYRAVAAMLKISTADGKHGAGLGSKFTSKTLQDEVQELIYRPY